MQVHNESRACTPPAEEAPFGLAPIRAILLSRPIHYYTHNGLIKMDGLIYILGIYDEFGVCTEVE